MNFQTHIPLDTAKQQIDYTSMVLLLGSCFTEHIGGKLDYFKFQNETNPLGILFQPLAIETIITRAINNEVFSEADIFYHNEQWHCFEAHSVLSHASKETCLNNLNQGLVILKKSLSTVTHLVLTYGTAWVYRNIATDKIVANCHKIPQKKFLKEILSVEEVTASISRTIVLLKSMRPSVQIIGTVSPVRHLKDGFIENSRSKAHLISGLQAVIENERGVHYFPSYELMMDQLRDYRFYTEDMLHPNATAIQFIWERFIAVWLDPSTQSLRAQIEVIQKGLLHKPFYEQSEAHQKFLVDLQQKIAAVQQLLPAAKF